MNPDMEVREENQDNSMLYCLQLSGINCTNCEAKIKKNLEEKVTSGLIKASVNILQEKVNLVVDKQQALKDSVQVLQSIGYQIHGQPTLLKGGSDSIRTVSFVYEINAKSEEIENIVRQTHGVTSVYRVHSGPAIKLTVSYNCHIIKGHELGNIINQRDPNYQTINHRVQSFSSGNTKNRQHINIRMTIFLCLFFFAFDMLLPLTGEWYDLILLFPSRDFGPFTLSVLMNITLTIAVLNMYAKPFIIRSYKNYTQSNSMDMQTLISLGCISAFLLFCFFMVKNIYDFLTSSVQDKYQISVYEIMQINDALASSAIIVLVVTIGKYFEGKVKGKIEAMTERIFPQSKLFQNMEVEFIKMKNRKLIIKEKKKCDVTLLEKDDIYKLDSGRVLVDSLIISGQFQAVKSAIDGNDETMKLQKGDRIQSGSIILHCTEDGLLQVENVFQKSVLSQIGTHIKLRQNEEQNNQSGIQAVCKTISKYFVKTVILISLLVMATWFFLLSFNYVVVPGCNFCWIVQRGIGVLVASCPCALGLAVPSVVAIVLNIAIKNGILIRNSGVLEKMKKCKIITFDKTGTLFTRINQIQQYEVFAQEEPNMITQKILWEIIAVVEKQLQHPLAQVLYKQSYRKCGVEGTNFKVILNQKVEVSKQGLSAKVLMKEQKQLKEILIGNRQILINNGIKVPGFEKKGEGATVLYLAVNKIPYMVLVMNTHSNLRPEAQKVIELLMKNKKQVHILSGDSKQSVVQLGRQLKIPLEYLHPEHSALMKMEWIKNTQKNLEDDQDSGVGVIMVGDGLNDIPCLQEAAIGVSINAKSELNINASDIIMLSENLYKIQVMVKLLERGNTFININLFWAFIYNLTIMPIVAGMFYGYDITISPVLSSVAMSCSSILVVAFSHILAVFNYDQEPNMSDRENMKDGQSSKYRMVQMENKNYSTLHEQSA